ncbi:hypothetical protein F4775DRAFT_131474 [Biscogniauxia sp. FL1348]|nr:hypothetical protein F4775DRAFT_131474 [Biscogniauxia sp. FL1348]
MTCAVVASAVGIGGRRQVLASQNKQPRALVYLGAYSGLVYRLVNRLFFKIETQSQCQRQPLPLHIRTGRDWNVPAPTGTVFVGPGHEAPLPPAVPDGLLMYPAAGGNLAVVLGRRVLRVVSYLVSMLCLFSPLNASLFVSHLVWNYYRLLQWRSA